MKFLKAMFEGFVSEAKKPCGKCKTCTCDTNPTRRFEAFCEANPGADQCKIYED